MLITGEIRNFIFANKDNNYYILNVIDKEGCRYTLCGYLLKPELDIEYDFTVKEVNHPKYGQQYQILNYQQHLDKSREGIISYLSSNLFPKVGLLTAKAIYDKLGPDALDIIVKDPSVLDDIVKKKQKEMIYLTILENRNIENLFVTLYQYSLTNKMVLKLYEKYHDKTMTIIKENPYRLIYELDGFGFKKADALAFKLGFSPGNMERLIALLTFTLLQTSLNYGLTYLTINQLFESSYQYGLKDYNLDISCLNEPLNEAIERRLIIKIADRLYLKEYNNAEQNVSYKLKLINEKKVFDYKENLFTSFLADFEKINQIFFSDLQKEAIVNAIKMPISIITGGPGTGKTTIIKAIIQIYASLHGLDLYDEKCFSKILLCAPTGKASKRMSEKTGFNAMTIHRALGYNFENEFMYNAKNLLPHRLIIIDETSMVDIFLAAHLLEAISVNSQIVFVGDIFQLPSVSPGAFLRDIIDAKMFKTTYLETNYRQEKGSNIIELAKMVKNGYLDENIFNLSNDLIYEFANNQNLISKTIDTIKGLIANGESLNDDIMVLAPMYKGMVGIDSLNRAISDTFNLNYSYEISRKGLIFKENDKVIQLTNSKEYEIMNGDLGYLRKKTITLKNDKTQEAYDIDFDYRNVKMVEADFENLNLAYAISVHKAQGSEFKTVILPISYAYSIMLKRKLIYTAITRAKEKLIIIGDINCLRDGIIAIEPARQTSLAGRFMANELLNEDEIPFDTFGEYAMEGITPYTFLE